ncbi:MAG: hypothetical protein LBQ66_04780 [Planctomycetaceae bacterium]|nr:hypothetical protein [Planctomycetaceae bacterium]
MIHWRRNRPAVGCPPYITDAFWRSRCRRVRRRYSPRKPGGRLPPYDH